MLKMTIQSRHSYAQQKQIDALVEPLLTQRVEYDNYRDTYISVLGNEDTVSEIMKILPDALIIAAWADDTQIVGWVVLRAEVQSAITMPLPAEPNYYELDSDDADILRGRIALVTNERLEFCFQTLRHIRSLSRIYD